MIARRELNTGLRLVVMTMVFLAMSCSSDGDEGCGDGCNTDGLIVGCTDGCGEGIGFAKGDGCLADCIDLNSCMGDCESCDDCDSACGDCGSDVPYDYNGDTVDGAIQIHVTSSLFEFVSNNLASIATAALGEGGDVNIVPKNDGTLQVCLPLGDSCDSSAAVDNCAGTGVKACQLNVKIRDIIITPRNNREVKVDVVIDNIDGAITAEGCKVGLSTKDNGTINFGLLAELPINSTDKNMEIYIGGGNNLDLNVSDLNINISGGFTCFLMDLGASALKNQIVDAVKGIIGAVTCRSCSNNSDCGGGGTCKDGLCVDGSSRKCQGIQVGAAAKLDLTSILQSIDPAAEAKIGLEAFLGSYVTTSGGGLQIGGRMGAKHEERSSLCVPRVLSPIQEHTDDCRVGDNCKPLVELNDQSGTIQGNRFDFGAGIAQGGLNQILWGAYSSGALCLSIGGDSEAIPELSMLNTGTFSALVDSLGSLTYGTDQPMMLQLRPQQPPEVKFREKGSMAIMDVNLENLEIDFYTVIDQRYQRVFTMQGDVSIPLGLSVKNNEISIAIGDGGDDGELDLGGLLDPSKLSVKNVEMISQSQVENLINGLPGLISGLGGTLLGEDTIPSINIDEMLGDTIPLGIDFVGSGLTMLKEDGKPAALGIFGKMKLPSGSTGLGAHLTPEITALDIQTRDPRELRAELAALRRADKPFSYDAITPQVVAHVVASGADVPEEDVEYAYSINRGPWSFWKTGPALKIASPRLAMEGKYNVRITARRVNDPTSGSDDYASFDFVNDYTAPQASLHVNGSSVVVDAQDNVYDQNELIMQYRIGNQAWSDRQAIGEIDMQDAIANGQHAVLEVFVEDPSGNGRSLRQTFGQRAPVEKSASAPAADPNGEGTCASSNGQGGLLGVLALLLLVFLRRRQDNATMMAASPTHISLAVLAILFLALGMGGCKNKGVPQTGDCEPACDSSHQCVSGICEALTCDDDIDCPKDGKCQDDGTCMAPTKCSFNDHCEHGHICDNGECKPSECSDSSECSGCTAPELPFCDYDDYAVVEAGKCECLSSLEMGQYGSWLNLVTLHDGTALGVAYHDEHGDVLVGEKQNDGTFDWAFVDGVPDGPVVLPPSGVRNGVKKLGNDAGRYITVVHEDADGTDVIHAAYQIADEKGDGAHLRYARGVRGSAGWSWKTIDVDEEETSGMFPRIVLIPETDQSDAGLAIIYMTGDIVIEPDEDAPLQYFAQVSVAYAQTRDPESADDFAITQDIDTDNEKAQPCAALCAKGTACITATNTCESVKKSCEDGNEDGECAKGDVCTADGCQAGVAGADRFVIVPEGLGLYTSAVVDENANVYVAYYDQIHGVLKYLPLTLQTIEDTLQLAPTGPAVVVDGQHDIHSTGDVGRWTDIHLTENDTLMIFYQDAGRSELKAAEVSKDGTSVNITLLDSGVYSDEDERNVHNNRVGASVNALPREEGGFDVFYQDSTDSVVRQIVWANTNAEPTDHPFPVYGTARGFKRDEDVRRSGVTPDADQQIEASKDGAFGFFVKALRSEDGLVIASKRINFEATETDQSDDVRMDVLAGTRSGGAATPPVDPGTEEP